eukprot:12361347-Ditylum_brightwellii.AAC.1
MGRGCISVQVHAPSGIDIEKKLKHHFSRSQRELVLSFPISPFLSCSDFAFYEVTKKKGAFEGMSKQQIYFLLQNHPRTAARHTPLPKQAHHLPITQVEDPIFHEIKFAVNKDGSTFMFAELLVDTNESYCPEECLIDVSMFCNEAAASLGQGVILETIPEDTTLCKTEHNREYDGCSIADGNDNGISTASNYSKKVLLPTMRMPHMQMQQALQNQVMQQKAEQESLMQAVVVQQALAQQQAFNLTQTALQQHQQGDLNQKLSA